MYFELDRIEDVCPYDRPLFNLRLSRRITMVTRLWHDDTLVRGGRGGRSSTVLTACDTIQRFQDQSHVGMMASIAQLGTFGGSWASSAMIE